MKSGESTLHSISPRQALDSQKQQQHKKQTSFQMEELYTATLGDEEWRIPKKYVLDKIIGNGSYGVVASCRNTETGEELAIKKNKNIFPQYLTLIGSVKQNSATDIHVPQNRSCISQLRILRELKILKHLKKHPNIITLHDLIIPDSYEKLTDVYIVRYTKIFY